MKLDSEKVRSNLPDFLAIGAARSGTTWLAKILNADSRIWLPDRKELHYFSRGNQYPSTGFLGQNQLWQRLLYVDPDNLRFKKEMIKAFGKSVLKRDLALLKWNIHYFLSNYSDAWYQQLFEAQQDKLTGEITPAYALLDEKDIHALATLLPQIKIMYIMRDPIERAWSTICYHESTGRLKLDEFSINDMHRYVSQPGVIQRSSYTDVIKRWQSVIPAERLLLMFYDEISENPQQLIDKVYGFLGIPATTDAQASYGKRINASNDRVIPDELAKLLIEDYAKEITALAEMPGSHASRWLEKYNRLR